MLLSPWAKNKTKQNTTTQTMMLPPYRRDHQWAPPKQQRHSVQHRDIWPLFRINFKWNIYIYKKLNQYVVYLKLIFYK